MMVLRGSYALVAVMMQVITVPIQPLWGGNCQGLSDAVRTADDHPCAYPVAAAQLSDLNSSSITWKQTDHLPVVRTCMSVYVCIYIIYKNKQINKYI